MKRLLLTLALLFPACDPAEVADFRDAQISAKVPEIDYARKLISACFSAVEPTAISLTTLDVVPGSLAGFVLTIESTAPLTEVDCAASILAGWSL